MSFLERFKGKTQLLKKQEVSEILGEKKSSKNTTDNKYQMHLLKITQNPQNQDCQESLPANIKKRKNQTQNIQLSKSQNVKSSKISAAEIPPKKIIQNPFLVQNQFFLEEQEHQAAIKKRKEQEIRERIEKEKKKRQQVQQKMVESIKLSPKVAEKFKKKQWVKLGGLGANIGGQEWTIKKKLQDKMLKFAQQIKKINTQKMDNNSALTTKHARSLHMKPEQGEVDPRSVGIKYSKSIQKPTFYTLEKTRYQSSELRTYNSDFDSPAARPMKSTMMQRQQPKFDPQQNQFSNLKLQRNGSELQRLQHKHKEFKDLVYQSHF